MDIASELRLAGLTVIEGRRGIGRTSNVAGIETVLTKTGADAGVAADINDIVAPANGVAYIERSGRVWLLADGPVDIGSDAKVFIAQQKGKPNESQKDSLAVLTAVLESVYAAVAPEVVADAVDGELEADQDESEGEDK